ncbi:hypothetical protein [Nevskia sp.]|uniref:hypothetical protein n=1 Tax=Nevskia sp. TaxID=1929292 RepID=UPI003F6F6232
MKAPSKQNRSAKAAGEPLPKTSEAPPWIGTAKQPGRLHNVLRVIEERYSADPAAAHALEKLKRLLTAPLAVDAWSKIDAIARKIGSPSAALAHKVCVAAAAVLLGDVDLANPPDPARRERDIAAQLRRIVEGDGDREIGDAGFTDLEREILFPDFVKAALRVANHLEKVATIESPLKVAAARRPNRDTNERMMFIRVVGATMKRHLGKVPISVLVTFTNTVFDDRPVSEQIVRKALSAQ